MIYLRSGIMVMGIVALAVFGACGDNGTQTPADLCAGVRCVNGDCDSTTGQCVCHSGYAGEACDRCADGYLLQEGQCQPSQCTTDADCGDDFVCNGQETCTAGGFCTPGSAVFCGSHAHCVEPTGDCACDDGYFDDNGECIPVECSADSDCDDHDPCNGEERCQDNVCVAGTPVSCQEHAHCDDTSGECSCDSGYHDENGACVANDCRQDSDCDDIDPCNGIETCGDNGTCEAGEPVVCGNNASCDPADGQCHCDEGYVQQDDACILVEDCPRPSVPLLGVVPTGTEIPVTLEGDGTLLTGTATGITADQPDAWTEAASVVLDNPGDVLVFARSEGQYCDTVDLRHQYLVQDDLPPAAGEPGSEAVAMDDDALEAWAATAPAVSFGEDVAEEWQNTDNALGAAQGTSTDIVSLGRGGSITLSFSPAITDGPGYDFAIFENSFSDLFLELAFVEVSSDGEHFVRFDSLYLGTEAISGYGQLDPQLVGDGLAGKYRQGFGTPFDLAVLRQHAAVVSGLLNPDAITHVRIVDIVGDGNTTDSFGHPIYDPYPTTGSADLIWMRWVF